MTALQKRAIKGKLMLKLESMGHNVSVTDTPEIVVFTDKPINKKSKKIGNYIHSWITSFGEIGAKKFIDQH